MGNKIEIRSAAKRRRSGMEIAKVSGKSEDICRCLIDNRNIQRADSVFVYAAANNEVDLTLFVSQMWQMGKRVAFPACSGAGMEYHEVTDWSQLSPGSFGILEPLCTNRPIIPSSSTVICVPGVAFSEEGNRIGMGKGYYDRYLRQYPFLYKIGLAFEFQMEYSWTPDYCDIAMDLLVTEQREVRTDEYRTIM